MDKKVDAKGKAVSKPTAPQAASGQNRPTLNGKSQRTNGNGHARIVTVAPVTDSLSAEGSVRTPLQTQIGSSNRIDAPIYGVDLSALAEGDAPSLPTRRAGEEPEEPPTFLGILVAVLLHTCASVLDTANRRYLEFVNRFDLRQWLLAMPIPWVRIYRFVRPYAWALPALAIIFALQLNTHLYYNLFLGFDMPQHLNNTAAIINTGTMPPPPFTDGTYQAHQAPLFYIFAAWVIILGNKFTSDAMQQVVPVVLLIAALLWVLLVTAFIQRAMRRVHWVWRTLALTLVMVIPMNVQASVMFSNDLPLIALGAFGVMILWFMARSGRYLDRGYWLRAAAIIGLAMAFKNNATIPMGTYVVFAGYAAWIYYREHRRDLARRVAGYALLGLPLMLVPFAINAWHTLRYTPNLVSVQTAPSSIFENTDIRYFTTFDTALFQDPFNHDVGQNSFWAVQYVTLHNDYYRFWGSSAYQYWPRSSMRQMGSEYDLFPAERFDTAVILQVLAIPVTLVMVFAFGYSLYRLIRFPRAALRDGSIVIVAVTVISEAAQALKVASYADVRWFLIPSRHLGFLFPILFVVGVLYVWKLVLRKHTLYSALMSAFLCLNFVAYSFFAFKLMWLPPTF